MKARVEIFYKDSVFDPQGNTICKSLQTLGFSRVNDVRMGKVIEIDLSDSGGDVRKDLEAMCEKLLANPVIESYKIRLNKEAE